MPPDIRRTIQILIVIILACAILYVRLFIPGHGNGADFADFYAGAVTDARGGDPYRFQDAWQTQKMLFYAPDYSGHPTVYSLKNPPPLTLILRPLTHLTQDEAYWIWVAIEFAAGGLGVFLLLDDWPMRARFLATAAVGLSPVVLWNIRVGQVSLLLALSFGLAVYWTRRGRPLPAGAVLSIGMVKPHLILPIAAVLFLAAPARARLPLLFGFLAGIVGWVAVTLVFDGGMIRYVHYVRWLTNLDGSSSPLAGQGDLAAIPGLLYAVLPPKLSAGLTVLGVVLACALVAVLARQSTRMGPWGESRLLGGGIVLFFAFLPYEHTSDQILLVLPLMLLIRPDGSGLREWPVVLATFLYVLTPLVLFHDHRVEGFNVLPAVSLLLAYTLARPGQSLAANPLHGSALLPVPGGAAPMQCPAQN